VLVISFYWGKRPSPATGNLNTPRPRAGRACVPNLTHVPAHFYRPGAKRGGAPPNPTTLRLLTFEGVIIGEDAQPKKGLSGEDRHSGLARHQNRHVAKKSQRARVAHFPGFLQNARVDRIGGDGKEPSKGPSPHMWF